ncbi:MAG: hypothetical protein AB3N24_10875, partial [Leisingera sp.]
MSLKNSASAAALLLFTGTSAFADITAADIWDSYQAVADAIGAELSGDLQTDRSQAVIEDGKIRLVLPQGAATVEISLPEQRFTNNTDGTVSVHLNEAESYLFVLTPKTGAAVSGEMLIRYKDAETTASGTPGDITFDFKVAESSAELRGIDFAQFKGSGISNLEVHAAGSGDTGTFRLVTGETIELSVQRSIGTLGYTTTLQDTLGSTQNTKASMSGMETKLEATLPRGGMSLLNLSQAMADGLKFGVQSTAGEGASTTEATLPESREVVSQSMTYGAIEASASADADGIAMAQKIDGIAFNMQLPAPMALPIALAMDTLETSMAAPVSQDSAPQDFSLQFRLGGLSLDDGIWSLIDPATVLPRDPATVAASFKGETTLLQNLLDFTALMAMKPGE